MHARLFCLLSLLPLCLAPINVPLLAGDVEIEGLPNFHKVTEELYRGGQPKAEGWERLRALGIKLVIDLRGDDSERGEREEAILREMGIKYLNIPLSALRRPKPAEVEAFFAAVDDPANWPVFVHCRRGADRTGAMVAIYRIARQGWTADQAYKEMRRLGFRWWYRGLKGFVYDFERDRNRELALEGGIATSN